MIFSPLFPSDSLHILFLFDIESEKEENVKENVDLSMGIKISEMY